MSKILHFFNILILYIGCFIFFVFFSPSFTVKASDFTLFKDPGISSVQAFLTDGGSYNYEIIPTGIGSPYSVYIDNSSNQLLDISLICFNIDAPCLVDTTGSAPNYKSYTITIDGISHTVNFCNYGTYGTTWGQFFYTTECSGTRVLTSRPNNDEQTKAIINFFCFGIGDFDYISPAQDIEDSNLDIVGLIGSFSTSTDTDTSTLSGFMSNFFKNVINIFTGGLFAGSTGSGNIFASSVPSCRLVWDSPSVSTIANYTDTSAVLYTIWVDGSSKIDLYQAGEWLDGASCSFSQLVLHDEPIVYDGVSPFYYSTGSAYQIILNYVLNNSNFSGGTSVLEAQNSDIKLETIISRIYIQAHRVDENGDNHLGAISYVDFSSGYPVVFEGVTGSISDIIPDDSGNGSNTVITQPFVVSGDNIVYGDTVTENNTTNNYYGEGLQIGGNIPFLNAAYWLIQAVLELIKTLYASLLVPFIVLGWTGHL